MANEIHTLNAINTLFYRAVMSILGHDPDAAYNGTSKPPVRQSWPTSGQPDWHIGDDVVFIRVTDVTGEDVALPTDEYFESDGKRDFLQTRALTRVLQLHLVAYGPNAYDQLVIIREALLYGNSMLRKAGLFVIPGADTPQRAPELYQGQWWERADFVIRFNDRMKFERNILSVETVPVTVAVNGAGASAETYSGGKTDISANG